MPVQAGRRDRMHKDGCERRESSETCEHDEHDGRGRVVVIGYRAPREGETSNELGMGKGWPGRGKQPLFAFAAAARLGRQTARGREAHLCMYSCVTDDTGLGPIRGKTWRGGGSLGEGSGGRDGEGGPWPGLPRISPSSRGGGWEGDAEGAGGGENEGPLGFPSADHVLVRGEGRGEPGGGCREEEDGGEEEGGEKGKRRGAHGRGSWAERTKKMLARILGLAGGWHGAATSAHGRDETGAVDM